MSEMIVSFPGGKKVDVSFGAFTVKTDQSRLGGGDASAPEPFALFLASIASCAGIYVLGFCQAREIDTSGLTITQKVMSGEHGGIGKIVLEINLPKGFPEKYKKAVIRSADQCAVKKTMFNPPQFEILAHIEQ
ncbi:MAG: OsmC family protein [Deltaproteobacteria bacterium]|nr:OsmC family protein [Deltaproteobacteria bacterium]